MFQQVFNTPTPCGTRWLASTCGERAQARQLRAEQRTKCYVQYTSIHIYIFSNQRLKKNATAPAVAAPAAAPAAAVLAAATPGAPRARRANRHSRKHAISFPALV